MARIKSNTINTKDCEKCKYCTLNESNKASIKIICSAHEKEYHYGQRLECNDYEKIKGDN